MRSTPALLLVLALCAGCSSGGSGFSTAPDLGVAPDLFLLSQCGHYGDVGNALGVGKFCMTLNDCTDVGMMTNICSSLGNGPTPSAGDTYFCTIYPCKLDAGVGQCGDNATCVCGSGSGASGCACTPNRCIGNPDAGP
jgi:hypothetical protein